MFVVEVGWLWFELSLAQGKFQRFDYPLPSPPSPGPSSAYRWPPSEAFVYGWPVLSMLRQAGTVVVVVVAAAAAWYTFSLSTT